MSNIKSTNQISDKILFVDDEPNILDSIKRILFNSDYNCFYSTSSSEAFEILKKEDIAVVISDINMPEMTGLEFLKKVEQLYPDSIKMILSGNINTNNLMEAVNNNHIWGFIPKPCTAETIILSIKGALETFTKNFKIKELTMVDELTQVYNRRYIFQELSRLIAEYDRYSHPFSVIMFDIDNFKKVNDIYGHQTGDDVLTKTAAAMKVSLRNLDIVGRYGGEEFLILLPKTDFQGAVLTAERLRLSVEKLDWPEKELKITISGGLCDYKGEGSELIINKADKNLYTAKDAGRNRICFITKD